MLRCFHLEILCIVAFKAALTILLCQTIQTIGRIENENPKKVTQPDADRSEVVAEGTQPDNEQV